MELTDKVAIVTGGASGIGAALARRFASDGARGVVVADRNADGAVALAGEIGGTGVDCDVTSETDIQALVALAQQKYGPVDLFCSNAGVLTLDDPGWAATSAPNARWQLAWEVHVMAHVYAARACLPDMVARGFGYFLNTASAAGLLNQIGGSPYSTTKHAAVGFAESLAITHAHQGIRVSVLCPQAVDTPLVDGLLGDQSIAEDGGPAGVDGVLSAEQVAEAAIAGLRDERFMILPHPEVAGYFRHKADDYDRWLGGMRKLRKRFPFPEPAFTDKG